MGKYILLCVLWLTSMSAAQTLHIDDVGTQGAKNDYYIIFSSSVDIYPLENDDAGLLNCSMVGYGRTIPGCVGTHFYLDEGEDYYTFTPEPGSWGADQHIVNVVDGTRTYLSWVFIWVDVYPGDFNHDGVIDDGDLSILLSNWYQYRPYRFGNVWLGTHEDPMTDEFVGIVNEDDLSLLLSWWHHAPEPSAFLFLVGGIPILWRRRQSKT